MPEQIVKKTGIARIIAACRYSIDGLVATFKNEAAFRQELFLFALQLPVLFFLPTTPFMKALLLCANTLVLIVELLNSAIEAIVNLASPEYHNLAKHAKDMGSAAVMISIILTLCLWGYAILTIFRAN